MHQQPLRRAAVFVALVVALAALALPARAQGGDDHEESEVEVGGLSVEVRPAIANPAGSVLVAAEYEVDEDDGEETESEEPEEVESEEPQESETEEPAGDTPAGTLALEEETSTADPRRGRPIAVEFTIDFGDGSGVRDMVLTEQDVEDGEGAAVAQHRYDEAGDYTVTVTATPTATGEPVVGQVVVNVGRGSARLGGKDRFDTAGRLARNSFPVDGEASAVLLARADGFADALAAAGLAAVEDAPVLLTTTADVPATVLAEIQRALGESGTVYLLGGEAAISADVATAIEALGYAVERIAGADRIETALGIAEFVVAATGGVDEVVLASAGNFPDALSGAAHAASEDAPVLLTGADSLDPRVAAFLETLGADVEVLVAGGPAAVSDAVFDELVAMGLDVERVSGEDRFTTSAELAEARFPDATAVVLATGANYPDALAGAAYAGRLDAPVLLVGETLPEPVREYLTERVGQINVVYVLGGASAVPSSVMAEVQALLGL